MHRSQLKLGLPYLAGTITLLVGLLGACRIDSPVNPHHLSSSPTLASIASECAQECELTRDARVLAAARYWPDSADKTTYVGKVLVSGSLGARVALLLETDASVAGSLPEDSVLSVTAKGVVRSFSFAELRAGIDVYAFSGRETVELRYEMPNRVRARSDRGLFRLTQRVVGGTVLSSDRPWIMTSSEVSTAAGACSLTGEPTQTVCGIDVTMTPVAPADHFLTQGAVFQSGEGSSASSTIEIAFSRSVRNVTVTIFDPTWQGNRAVASTRASTIQQVEFAFNNTPGVPLVDSKAFTVVDIRNIALIPADADYVAYSLTFDPDTLPCPPTGDPILDSANVRTPLTDQWALSKSDGLERGGWIYENLSAPGTYFIQPDLAAYRSLCRYTVREPFPLSDSRPVAYWHTHIVDWGTTTDPCPDNPPGTLGSFGLSPQDISEMNTKVFPDGNKYPSYMVGMDFVFRARPGETHDTGWQWSFANRCR